MTLGLSAVIILGEWKVHCNIIHINVSSHSSFIELKKLNSIDFEKLKTLNSFLNLFTIKHILVETIPIFNFTQVNSNAKRITVNVMHVDSNSLEQDLHQKY